jgi:hypothetical protein
MESETATYTTGPRGYRGRKLSVQPKCRACEREVSPGEPAVSVQAPMSAGPMRGLLTVRHWYHSDCYGQVTK